MVSAKNKKSNKVQTQIDNSKPKTNNFKPKKVQQKPVQNVKETVTETHKIPSHDSSHNIYAGFWARFFAMVVDCIFCSVTLGLGYLVNMYAEPAKGWTVGKYLLGIRVVDEHTMAPAGFVKNLIMRGFVGKFILDSITFGLGYLLPLFDDKKQALHDKVAGTIVIKKEHMK